MTSRGNTRYFHSKLLRCFLFSVATMNLIVVAFAKGVPYSHRESLIHMTFRVDGCCNNSAIPWHFDGRSQCFHKCFHGDTQHSLPPLRIFWSQL